jgi:hypothetical protein
VFSQSASVWSDIKVRLDVSNCEVQTWHNYCYRPSVITVIQLSVTTNVAIVLSLLLSNGMKPGFVELRAEVEAVLV